MEYCKSCILPDSRPGVTLNEEGICSACIGAKEKKLEINWQKREEQLIQVFNKHKNQSNDYDCIIPVSGGKDSTWQVHTLINTYGLKPLAVTYKPSCRTELGKQNLQNLINLGVDHIDFSVNPEIERKFMLKTLKKSGTASLVQHMAIWAITLRLAQKLGIKLVVWGENPGLEYGGNKKERENFQLNREWIKKYGVTDGTFAEDWVDSELSLKDLYPYTIPTEAELRKAKIESIFLGWFLKWDPLMVADIAKSVGFTWADKPVLGYYKFSDLDDDFIVIHHYIKLYKFGITRLWDNLSIEIRNQRMTREQAIEYVKHNIEKKPIKQINTLINFLKISEREFLEIMESFRNHEIWKKDNKGNWYLPECEKEFGFTLTS